VKIAEALNLKMTLGHFVTLKRNTPRRSASDHLCAIYDRKLLNCGKLPRENLRDRDMHLAINKVVNNIAIPLHITSAAKRQFGLLI
jgi:hypothetical protein